jgi:hypothetical protein
MTLLKRSNPKASFMCSNKKCMCVFCWSGNLYKGGYRPEICPICKFEFTNRIKAVIRMIDY